jgi:Amt family ammonium transporter
LILVGFCAIANAQIAAPSAPAEAATAAPLIASTPTHIDNGLTAWMLVSSALVLLMVPGLALFYGGMVRAKNVLNMFLCCMVAIGVIGLHWVFIGYAMAFPRNARSSRSVEWEHPRVRSERSCPSFCGADADVSVAHFGDSRAHADRRARNWRSSCSRASSRSSPPALIVGSVAERVKFGPFILFMLIWSTDRLLPRRLLRVERAGRALDIRRARLRRRARSSTCSRGVSALAMTLSSARASATARRPMPPH